MIPYHSNPSNPNRIAHAPYNFVPLTEQIVLADEIPGHDRYAKHTHTGYLDCILTTLTPTYTRTVLNPEFFARWNDDKPGMMRDNQAREIYAQFFSLDDAQRPIIPGSSLRGMTRALIEIVGHGKMQWVNDEDLIFRAVGDPSSLGILYRSLFLGENKASLQNMKFDYPSPRIKGGYLRITHNGYAIQPAKEHLGESFVHVEYEDADSAIKNIRLNTVYDIFVMPIARSPSNRGYRVKGILELDIAITPTVNGKPTNGLVGAKLIVSGHMAGKHPKHLHCAIYEPDPSAQLISIPERIWALYSQDHDTTKGINPRKIENDGDPLFYMVTAQGELVFFGPTMMFRVPYDMSPFDLVPGSLKEDKTIDLAAAIFGYVTKGEKAKSLAGRVFFTDAICDPNQENIWLPDDIITPKILSSPKPTTFQHYLVQDRNRNHDPDNRGELAHYGTPTPEGTVIRGHKLYWHKQSDLGARDFCEPKELNWASDTQHTQIKPVTADKKFSFKVYFENLTDIELGALLWVLDLPEGHHHKIGMGKPLGLGSVEIKPHLVLTDRPARYNQLLDGDDWHTGEYDEENMVQFKQAFERYILDQLCKGQEEQNEVQELSQVMRIQMLLKMLQWPGPEQSLTRYMKIEPQNKKNEYRDRPVLPDPLNIESNNETVTFKSKLNVVGSGKSSENIDFSSTGKSAGMTWLENTSKELKINLDDLLKKRPKDLPKRWTAIQESRLKNDVLNEIAAQLKANGIWDNPPTPKLEDMVEFFKSQIRGEGT